MEDKAIVERPIKHVVVEINSISNELQEKIKVAVQEVVNNIKERHLS
jgi:hypothetical protein